MTMTLPERIDLIRRYGLFVSDDGFVATSDVPVHIDDSEMCLALLAHDDLLAACRRFCERVEAGEIRSTATYHEMKAAVTKAKGGEA